MELCALGKETVDHRLQSKDNLERLFMDANGLSAEQQELLASIMGK